MSLARLRASRLPVGRACRQERTHFSLYWCAAARWKSGLRAGRSLSRSPPKGGAQSFGLPTRVRRNRTGWRRAQERVPAADKALSLVVRDRNRFASASSGLVVGGGWDCDGVHRPAAFMFVAFRDPS